MMTPRLAVHILPIPVETITSPIMEANMLNVIITDVPIRVKSCFFLQLLKNFSIMVTNYSECPRRITLAKRENTGGACGL